MAGSRSSGHRRWSGGRTPRGIDLGQVIHTLVVSVNDQYHFVIPVTVAFASGRQHLRPASTCSQSPNHDRPAELRCRGRVPVEQSFGCSTETGDDTAHFQATTEDLIVPHLMCRRTEGTSTTAERCCGVFCDSVAGYETADLLTWYWPKRGDTLRLGR